MKTKRFWTLMGAVLLVLVVSAIAWATAYSLGASSFKSNGDRISGWYWLRSPGQTATWDFATDSLQGCKNLYINLNPLVTNGVNGGSGYGITVKFTIQGTRSFTGAITAENPFRPKDFENSGGVGYPCYGHSNVAIPPSVYQGVESLKVTISYPFPGDHHVAVNKDCISLGYSR